MSQKQNSGILARYLPTFLLFIIGVLALLFSMVSSKIIRSDSRIRSLREEEEDDEE